MSSRRELRLKKQRKTIGDGNMKNFYDDDVKEEKTTQKTTQSNDDLPVKWKEALAQIDYGIDVESSTIYMFGDITDGTLYDFMLRVRAILHMRDESKKEEPINIIINSDGGDVYEALGMIDYLQSLNVKVNTICRGRAMSAAALLLCSGTGVRGASKNSTIMFHEMSSGIYGKSSDMKANVQHMEKLEEILVTIMSQNSNKNDEFWKDKTIKDYYLSPEEALQLGVIDTIIEPKFARG
jgi:ATP-dependent Clp protease protease subunit